MSISVVIPSYNRLNTLPLAIDSVLAQTLSADEIIVIDDGSTDGTSEFVKQHYPSIKLVTQKNAGVSHARNQGIRMASGQCTSTASMVDGFLNTAYRYVQSHLLLY